MSLTASLAQGENDKVVVPPILRLGQAENGQVAADQTSDAAPRARLEQRPGPGRCQISRHRCPLSVGPGRRNHVAVR